MAVNITIRQAEGNYVVRAGGAILGETSNALELVEGDYPAVIYFPRADIGMPFLEPSKTTSHCPHKGDATYFSIQTKSVLIEDAAWSYEAPLKGAEQIAGYIAFYKDKVAVERV